jgi:hypothetical protein
MNIFSQNLLVIDCIAVIHTLLNALIHNLDLVEKFESVPRSELAFYD